MPAIRPQKKPWLFGAFGKPPIREAGEKLFKGASEAAKEQRQATHEQTVRTREVDAEQLKQELRRQRFEKMLKRIENPEEREAIESFLHHTAQSIQQWQQHNVSKQKIETEVHQRIERFVEYQYPNSPYNKDRIRIMEKGLLPEER